MRQDVRGRHVPALDGVRGLAILGVLASHILPALADAFRTPWAWDTAAWTHSGASGVDLFFVLSGFLITGILLDTRDSPDYWRSFFGRRALRIFPLYYAFLATMYLRHPPDGRPWTFWLHLSNWRRDLGVSSNVLTWHLWSLAIEEQFYFVWPVLARLLPRRRVGPACLAIAVASAAARGAACLQGAGVETLHRMTPLALDGLALGGFLAWSLREAPGLAGRLRRLAPAILALSLAVMWGLGRLPLPFPTVFAAGRLVVSIGGGALVLLAADGSAWVDRVLSARPLRWMGRYCYGLYLLHPIIVVKGTIFLRGLVPRLPAAWLFPVWSLSIVAGFLGSFLLAALSWRLIEAPCLAARRFFPYRPAISPAVPPRPHFDTARPGLPSATPAESPSSAAMRSESAR